MFADALGTAVLAALLALFLYKRLRRNDGRQRIIVSRLVLRVFILTSLAVSIASLLLISNRVLPGVGVLGAALGWLAIRLTTFERDATDSYYTRTGRSTSLSARCSWVGLSIAFSQSHRSSVQDPRILCLLIVFYLRYYGGVLTRSRTSTWEREA